MDLIGGIAGNVVGGLTGGLGGVARGAGGLISGLFKRNKSQLEELVNSMQKSQQFFQEQVQAPLDKMLASVDDGAWTGTGAEKFKTEIASVFKPQAQQMSRDVQLFGEWLQKSDQQVDQAEAESQKLVEGLRDVFQNIYRG
ncbi:MAG: hypothetical protein ACKOC5_03515 [Chloroflexota bacterium]